MEASKREPLSSWLGLIALLVVSIYALIDRQIFVLLAEPIRRDMALSDSQLGLLQGLGLALVGVITTYPISWVADRYDRRWVMASCVLVWSVAVVLSGLAPNFVVLLIGASFVGVGQAGINPAVYAIIPDLFAPPQPAAGQFRVRHRRSPGGAMGLALAGLLIAGAGFARAWPRNCWAAWRAGVWRSSSPSSSCRPRSRCCCRCRAAWRWPPGRPPGAEGPSVWGFLKRHADVQLAFFVAIAFGTFGLASIGSWVPVIAARDYGQSPVQAGAWLGAMSFITGVAGFGIGTVVMRVLQPRFDARLPMLAQAVIALTSAGCSLLIGVATNLNELYGFWGLQSTFLMVEAMIMPTVLQNMTPAHLRARLFAVLSLFELVAGGVSPVAVGCVVRFAQGSSPLADDRCGEPFVRRSGHLRRDPLAVGPGLCATCRGDRGDRHGRGMTDLSHELGAGIARILSAHLEEEGAWSLCRRHPARRDAVSPKLRLGAYRTEHSPRSANLSADCPRSRNR